MERFDERIRTRRPLIHCLTNPVSMNDIANALLAIGASPIMADDAIESAEVTARANGLYLNLGMPSLAKLEAMLRSGRTARERGIPIVFDPVGVSLTAFRGQAAARILSEVRPTIIRGNFSEIGHLAGIETGARGVDSLVAGVNDCPDDRLAQARASAEAVSRRYHAVTVLTGARDVITDGTQTWVQAGGSVWLTRMTGAGCVLGGILAAYAAVAAPAFDPGSAAEAANGQVDNLPSEPIAAPVLAAFQRFGAAAREAERRVLAEKSGSGSFRVHLIDSLG